jgi:hypothetical protein
MLRNVVASLEAIEFPRARDGYIPPCIPTRAYKVPLTEELSALGEG